MKAWARYWAHLALLRTNQAGATLVEFAIVLSLFLLIFFGLIDFGRLAYNLVVSERAMHAAARIAAVRPAACAGVPESVDRDADADGQIDYGTSCSADGGGFCENPGQVTCTGNAANATASEIWALVERSVPAGTSISNLRFTYDYDPRLVFLGGPYVPVVTVELDGVTFDFVTPLSALAGMAGSTAENGVIDGTIEFPGMSVSLPGEDLAQGENG